MPYTFEDARAEVGKGTDWEMGRRASIKKWEQIAAGDEETYLRRDSCGMCFVVENQAGQDFCACLSGDLDAPECPALPICDAGLRLADPQKVIDTLKQLELPGGET